MSEANPAVLEEKSVVDTDVDKDFVLFVDKAGRFSGDYEGIAASTETAAPQSAINEETGEINWDCPCLQSALAPPCGEYFREAFSCFVASQTEPKGSDCLEKFSAMQDCFRAHPEIYLKDMDMQEEANRDLDSGPKSSMDIVEDEAPSTEAQSKDPILETSLAAPSTL